MNKNDIEIYKNNFRHFGARLSLRYGILITFEKYVDLCKEEILLFPVERRRKDGRGFCKIGYIDIDNQKVRVIKGLQLKGQPLLTVLKPTLE